VNRNPPSPGNLGSLGDLLGDCIPDDHARQVSSRYYIQRVMHDPERDPARPAVVVDLGCGRGDSVELFRRQSADVVWVGVDIPDSMEAQQRTRDDAPFVRYDGWSVPLRDASVDVVYSHQVLEHVRDPETHLREVVRVLRPGGWFIGSTSQFEPYHSRSYWNFTVYGFCTIVTDAGLDLVELRPGIDGVTLVLRTFLGRPKSFSKWFGDGASPLHTLIDEWGASSKRRPALVNLRKLQFAGQFAFCARRSA
jgi:SAM-dependent methyltransferase